MLLFSDDFFSLRKMLVIVSPSRYCIRDSTPRRTPARHTTVASTGVLPPCRMSVPARALPTPYGRRGGLLTARRRIAVRFTASLVAHELIVYTNSSRTRTSVSAVHQVQHWLCMAVLNVEELDRPVPRSLWFPERRLFISPQTLQRRGVGRATPTARMRCRALRRPVVAFRRWVFARRHEVLIGAAPLTKVQK